MYKLQDIVILYIVARLQCNGPPHCCLATIKSIPRKYLKFLRYYAKVRMSGNTVPFNTTINLKINMLDNVIRSEGFYQNNRLLGHYPSF
jgi:hypothetical protein